MYRQLQAQFESRHRFALTDNLHKSILPMLSERVFEKAIKFDFFMILVNLTDEIASFSVLGEDSAVGIRGVTGSQLLYIVLSLLNFVRRSSISALTFSDKVWYKVLPSDFSFSSARSSSKGVDV